LTWQNNSLFATGVIVQQAIGSGTWATVAQLAGNATSYNNVALSPGTQYSYRVQAIDSAGSSPYSNTVTITTPVPPATPTGATITYSSTRELDLAWTNHATNATGYRVLRSVIGGEFVEIASSLPPTATTFKDTGADGGDGTGPNGLAAGTEYIYHIQCFNIAGVSDFTGVHGATIANAPANLIVSASNQAVTLDWTAPAFNGNGADLTYNVYRGTASAHEAALPVATGITSTTYTDSGLTNGQSYYYIVTTVDPGGESLASNESVAKPYGPETFTGWANAWFGVNAPASVAGELADPAHDGLSNLAKYALGLNPLAPAAFQPILTYSAGAWQFTYQRPADRTDITYTVQVSPNLSSASWTTNGVTLAEIGTGDPQTWQANCSPGSGSKLFFRLQITSP
jgi:fibronectin type 3 domain-containing protein